MNDERENIHSPFNACCYREHCTKVEKQRDDLMAAFNKSISKVESATCCHPNAVRTLLDEAIEIWGEAIASVKESAC